MITQIEQPEMAKKTKPSFEIQTSRQFQSWLGEQQASLLFSTYQVGKVFMLGTNPDESLHVTERTFERCMGLGVSEDANTFWMSSLYQLWRFENSVRAEMFRDYDKVYLPQMAYTTGDLDIHDIMVDEQGNPVFVNTLFSCLATISETHSFKPLWKPRFVSRLAPEDRCHLNGLAAREGKPAFVTAVGMTDVADGWREHRRDGGLVMDVESNEIICQELSMPHSPRWYNGKLYLLEAGTGYFGFVDLNTGKFERIAFCPGFLRGLDFAGDYAIVGTSGIRENRTFSDLQLEENLEKVGVDARCALHIINLKTGAIEHWVRIDGVVNEIYDVKVLNQTIKPLIIGTRKDEIKKMISIEDNPNN